MTSLRKRMLEDLQIRNYASSTVECYDRAGYIPNRAFMRELGAT